MPLDRSPNVLTKRFAHSTIEFKQVAEDQTKTWFEGIASTPTPDRGNDTLDPKGAMFELPMPFLYHHDTERPVGQITEAKVTSAGIKVKGYVEKVDGPPTLKERLDVARTEMKTGLMRGLSIGWIPKEYQFKNDGGLDVKTWAWLELSGVTVPMNSEATVTMVKALDRKAASGSTDFPLSPQDDPWDSSAAEGTVRKWASSDGSGDKDKIDWAKYASAFFWKDDEAAGESLNFGDFKLGFAHVDGGKPEAVWRGVRAAAAVMQGARGGVDIPDADRAGVRSKIEAYYAKARKQYNDDTIVVPWANDGKAAAAASGNTRSPQPSAAPKPPGVSGPPSKPKGQQMTTQAERLSSWENKRGSLATQLANLLKTAEEDGDRNLTADESTEYDRLKAEVETADLHIKRLRESEIILATARQQQPGGREAAKPVSQKSGEDETESLKARRGEGVMRPNDNLPKGMGLARYAKALAYGKAAGTGMAGAIEYAKQWDGSTPEVALALKTGVAAGTTSDATWAGPLVYNQNLVSEFLEFLRPQTIIGKITGFRMVPFNIRFPTQTAGSTIGWVGQGKPAPVSSLAFSSASLGFAKVSGIVVTTMELARFSSPSSELLIRNDMTAQMIQFLDQQFIDPGVVAVANVNPASVTNGASNIRQAAAAWTSQANVITDVSAFLQTFAVQNIALDNTCYWVMTPAAAIALSMIVTTYGAYAFPTINVNGGTFFGLPVVTSNSVPNSVSAGSIVALVKAGEINMADDGQVAIDITDQASLQMDTAPSNDATVPTATTTVSLWQTESVGIRASRVINWYRRRGYGVGYIDNMHTA